MVTRTRIVLLMHPKEHRRVKCNTGRLTHLNLAASEIVPGLRFDDHPRVRALIDDPANLAVLLYPGKDALVLGRDPLPAAGSTGRRLVVFLIDATWHDARAVARQNPGLLALPRVALRPRAPSRYRIKRQPAAWCLSTLEAVHELLLCLEAAGLDDYPDKRRLLAAFDAMQDYQVRQTAARRSVRTLHRVRGPRQPLPRTEGTP